jgi:hypothetical protein
MPEANSTVPPRNKTSSSPKGVPRVGETNSNLERTPAATNRPKRNHGSSTDLLDRGYRCLQLFLGVDQREDGNVLGPGSGDQGLKTSKNGHILSQHMTHPSTVQDRGSGYAQLQETRQDLF